MKVELVFTDEQITAIAKKMLELSTSKPIEKTESKEVFLKVRDVAELLNIKEQTVRKHIKDGFLKATKVSGSVRISNKEIERYANKS